MTKINVLVMSTLLALGACGGKGSEKLEKLKDEACACKDKACAEKVEKKADKMLSDATIKKHGEKGMELAFGVAMCLAQAKGE